MDKWPRHVAWFAAAGCSSAGAPAGGGVTFSVIARWLLPCGWRPKRTSSTICPGSRFRNAVDCGRTAIASDRVVHRGRLPPGAVASDAEQSHADVLDAATGELPGCRAPRGIELQKIEGAH